MKDLQDWIQKAGIGRVTIGRAGVAALVLAAVGAWAGAQTAGLELSTHPATARELQKPASSAAKRAASSKAAASKTAAKSGTRKTSALKKPVHAVSSAASKGRLKAASAARAAMASLRSARLKSAFVASAQLRPMAQQLMTTRAATAYTGVANYAKTHPGDGAAAAYLALGHAEILDKHYDTAETDFHLAASSDALDDYAEYLGAQAAVQGGKPGAAHPLLDRFAERHPSSIFAATAPVLQANAYLAERNAAGALGTLQPVMQTAEAGHTDFLYALARAYQMQGNNGAAAPLYRNIYLLQPLSVEADGARQQLAAMNVPLTAAERKAHADQMFDAKRYGEALNEYQAIEREGGLSNGDRAALEIYAAVCELKLKKLNRRDVDKLPGTNDDSAALKLYLYAELDRNANDLAGNDGVVAELVQKFPNSRWLEEALYSGGNMYLLKKDAVQAIHDYELLVTMFPTSQYAPSSHWRAAWLNYRLRRYPEAARLMDEQIAAYPAGIEVPSALYWRGRIYEDEEHNYGQALNYYSAVAASYPNYYYAVLARQRITVLQHGGAATSAAPATVLAHVPPPKSTELIEALPDNDEHLIKARLLANAALNEYIAAEIAASPASGQWGALAEAEIYNGDGDATRALQAMKRSGISFFGMPVAKVPPTYWRLMFPRPYWETISADAQRNGLDPNLVAALIRQESEFNPGAVSRANAYGLMQLIPSTAKGVARKEGVKKFSTPMLLQPATNLQLGTANLKSVLGRFGGQVEYALAAYNAGDVPVRQWLEGGDFKDVPEFVESIPYTETRDYVQAIVRTRELYRQLYVGH